MSETKSPEWPCSTRIVAVCLPLKINIQCFGKYLWSVIINYMVKGNFESIKYYSSAMIIELRAHHKHYRWDCAFLENRM